MIVAHRGACRERVENTLPAFARALELSADGIELDVHATRDGMIVVHHDPVPRARPGSAALAGRPIADLSFEELRSFRFPDESAIPTLAEVFELVGAKAMVYVEIKGKGIERGVTDCLAAAPAGARFAVHGFDHRAVKTALGIRPGLRGGILLESYLVDPAAAMRAAGATDLWEQWEFIDADLCARVHEAGGKVIAWTVDSPSVARSLLRMGVDELCTNVCGELRAALAADGGASARSA
jgi:glycerophosphoryl diester phosphodiesterase